MARRTPLVYAMADEIRDRRLAAGLTQEEVWTAAKITKTTYREIETGHRVVNAVQLDDIATVLKTTAAAIFTASKKRLADSADGQRSHAARIYGDVFGR
jgi:transcriptional regulator with XRE-family HTH domain